ncbi:hypothetical protein U1Q18_019884 [Sarracenia purpurea var. burkii]
MKSFGALVASVLVASTAALTSSSSTYGDRDLAFYACSNEGYSSSSSSSSGKVGIGRSHMSSSHKGKFEPKFDGLRFIETLVTAHR